MTPTDFRSSHESHPNRTIGQDEGITATTCISVVHYVWSLHIGGITRFVKDLTEAQQSTRLYQPKVLLGQTIESAGSGEHSIPVAELRLRSGFDLSLRIMLRAFRVFRCHDLIHLHNFHPTVALAAILSRRPIVFTEHGLFAMSETGGTRSKLKRFLFSFFLNHCVSAVTYNSKFTESKSKKYYGLTKTKSIVILNGTKNRQEKPRDDSNFMGIRHRLDGRFVIGTFSRLTPRKRIDRLIEAIAELADLQDIAVLIVGDGPAATSLKKQVEYLGISSCAVFAGAHTNIASYISIMDVCVFPAENEPFGLVALEALSAGKPTLVYADGGGLLEIVKPLELKDVVENTGELAERISHYRNKSNSARDANKRRAYADTFSIDRTARNFAKLYKSIALSPVE